jgi:hypothetical protein
LRYRRARPRWPEPGGGAAFQQGQDHGTVSARETFDGNLLALGWRPKIAAHWSLDVEGRRLSFRAKTSTITGALAEPYVRQLGLGLNHHF